MDDPPSSGFKDDDFIDGDPPFDPPQAAMPSVWLFRGTLAALAVSTVLAAFLIVSPPASEGKAEPTRTFATATRPSVSTATPTQQGAAPSVTVNVPTQSPTPSPTATVSTAERSHTVVSGETLSLIAANFDTTVEAIVALNPGLTPNSISTGQVLRIPPAR
jgi:LysM repeat protein